MSSCIGYDSISWLCVLVKFLDWLGFVVPFFGAVVLIGWFINKMEKGGF